MLEHRIPTIIVSHSDKELKNLTKVFRKMPELSLMAGATDQNQALSLIKSYVPQLVVTDVQLNDCDGLKFVQRLFQRNIYPEIVFVAPDDSLAYDALQIKPLDFLLKPLQEDEVSDMVERLLFKQKREELKRKMDIYARSQDVTIKRVFYQKKGIVVLYLNEIVFCKAEKSKTVLTLINDEQIYLKTNIAETTEIINNQFFFKISRSYCINRNYLRKIDKKNSKCLLYYEGLSWEIPASRNIIKRLESLYTRPVY